MARQSTVYRLPQNVRKWLERALTENNFSGYEALEKALAEQGFVLSKSAIHRYGQKIQRRIVAIKESTEAAKMIAQCAEDESDARSEALMGLIQGELFNSLVNILDKDMDDVERLKLMSSTSKNIAALTNASTRLKAYQSDFKARLDAKFVELEKEQTIGLSAEILNKIKSEVYGVM